MNNPVDFSTASLLKEKGFPQNLDELTSKWFYYTGKYVPGSDMPYHEWKDYDGYSLYYKDFTWGNESNMDFYEAPTIADVIMWLYEKYEIWIYIQRVVIGSDEWGFGYVISYLPNEFFNAKRRSIHLETIFSFKEGISSYSGAWNSPKEAYEAAIQYCLEKII